MPILLNIYDTTLPIDNPVLKFLIILIIILFAPILLNKVKVPHLLGLIIAGAFVGPNGLNLIERDSGIVLSGTAGLLYIMFLAGLEINLADFKKNRVKSLVFGLYTFIIPMILGTVAGYYMLQFSLPTSILLASMFASHTLIAYPLVSKLGVAKNIAVNVTVGGTMITDVAALLVLAAIVGMSTGDANIEFWIRLGISIILFGAAIFILFPIIGRWFFKHFDDGVTQYIFVLAMVFLGAVMAELAGIESIIGAFLAGLAMNRLVPHTSPLMNRIDFVGNAIFIPFFLISVGMLIDFRVFVSDLETLKVAGIMIITATAAKFIAALLTQKTFRFTVNERRLIFGLSNAQAAATLAAVLVGYNTIIGNQDGEPIRLLNESVLNGTIIMILVTCTISSFVAQRAAENVALSDIVDDTTQRNGSDEKFLVAIDQMEDIDEALKFAISLKSSKGPKEIYVLNVIDVRGENIRHAETEAHKLFDKATNLAAATDNLIVPLLRYDQNITHGIVNVIKEQKITDLIIELKSDKGFTGNFQNNLNDNILVNADTTTIVYFPVQPLSTIKRHLIIIPEKAETEIGFGYWLVKMWNLAKNTSAQLVFYATRNTTSFLMRIQRAHPINARFQLLPNFEDMLIVSRDLRKEDGLVFVLSRKNSIVYQTGMEKVPQYIGNYFSGHNFILLYPAQIDLEKNSKINYKNATILEPIEKLDEIGKTVASVLKRKIFSRS